MTVTDAYDDLRGGGTWCFGHGFATGEGSVVHQAVDHCFGPMPGAEAQAMLGEVRMGEFWESQHGLVTCSIYLCFCNCKLSLDLVNLVNSPHNWPTLAIMVLLAKRPSAV